MLTISLDWLVRRRNNVHQFATTSLTILHRFIWYAQVTLHQQQWVALTDSGDYAFEYFNRGIFLPLVSSDQTIPVRTTTFVTITTAIQTMTSHNTVFGVLETSIFLTISTLTSMDRVSWF